MRRFLRKMCCGYRSPSKVFALLFIIFILGIFLRPFTGNDKPTERDLTDSELQELQNEIKRGIEKGNVVIHTEKEEIQIKTFPRAEPTLKPTEKLVTEKREPQHPESIQKPIMAILVISCNRPSVKRCLDGIFKYKPDNVDIPVIVSQDCGDQPTAEVIQSYGNKVTHIKQPDLGDVKNVPSHMRRFMGYYKISRHYKWALSQVFSKQNIDSVVIVEDDLDIAPDFFEYFMATRPLLSEDPTLYCVSAWNDNGKVDSIDTSAIDTLYRSDFFPGLGWLMTRQLWLEFADKWPLGFWDDWIRAPEQRKGRACIRPEISRTRTFGRIGVSLGQFYDQYLQFIKLNDKPYPFLEYDLNHLLKENYDRKFRDKVYSTRESQDNLETDEPIRVTYHNKYEFEHLARQYGIMTDFKAGVPRTAYMGIVTIYKDGRRIFIVPDKNWKKYEE